MSDTWILHRRHFPKPPESSNTSNTGGGDKNYESYC